MYGTNQFGLFGNNGQKKKTETRCAHVFFFNLKTSVYCRKVDWWGGLKFDGLFFWVSPVSSCLWVDGGPPWAFGFILGDYGRGRGLWSGLTANPGWIEVRCLCHTGSLSTPPPQITSPQLTLLPWGPNLATNDTNNFPHFLTDSPQKLCFSQPDFFFRSYFLQIFIIPARSIWKLKWKWQFACLNCNSSCILMVLNIIIATYFGVKFLSQSFWKNA